MAMLGLPRSLRWPVESSRKVAILVRFTVSPVSPTFHLKRWLIGIVRSVRHERVATDRDESMGLSCAHDSGFAGSLGDIV